MTDEINPNRNKVKVSMTRKIEFKKSVTFQVSIESENVEHIEYFIEKTSYYLKPSKETEE